MKKILFAVSIFCLMLLSGCGKVKGNKTQNLCKNSKIIYSEQFNDISSWQGFADGKSKINLTAYSSDEDPGNLSLKIDFDIKEWGGIGNTFKEKQSWLSSDILCFKIKSDGVKNFARIEIADNGGERFEKIVAVSSKKWEEIVIPLNEMGRRSDWQPAGVPADGLTLTDVEGISISLAIKGSGTWIIDDLKIARPQN